MKKFQIPRITPKEYNAMLKQLEALPEYKRNIAEKKLFLIKSYEATARKQIRRMGKKFLKGESIEKFCEQNQVNVRTFYGYINEYEKQGLEGMIPDGWGHNKGSSQFDVFLPIVKKILSNGKMTVIDVYRKLIDHCIEHGLKIPKETGIRRLIERHDLLQKTPEKKKLAKIKNKSGEKKHLPKKPTIQELSPDYIKIVDKKSFNIAMYKYSLVLPFLNPDLPGHDKLRLIDGIANRTHHPYPGVTLKIKPSTINRYVLLVEKHGVDALIPKHCFRKTRKYKNQIKAKITIRFDKPWESIKQLENVIEKIQTPFKQEQKNTLGLLRKITVNSCRYMHRPVSRLIDIEPDILQELKELKYSTHRNKSTKATAILMAYNNRPTSEISLKLNYPVRTIEGWFIQFKKRGMPFIKGERDYSKQENERSIRKNRIVDILHNLPENYNINRASWSLQSIADVYKNEFGIALSPSTISRDIKKTDYTWKRAKRVLTSPDPKYKEKTNLVLNTLQNLGPSDGFFFIDEAGPWQVKKYGGKSLTLKVEVKIFPQFQSAKGRVSLISALDALNNQVTSIFIKSKNTMSVMTLIEILYYKYHKYSTLNLTWDCASWHKSKQLQEFLTDLEKRETGPRINIVPLPKRAQFLNVIEAVFGGVKRAVVFNSDYQSEYDMKMAISRHFVERNEFFRKNPKKAGNKIWDKEAYELGEFEGGVYKKQM